MGTGYRGANSLLSPKPGHNVSNIADALDTNIGVYFRRIDETMAGISRRHDMAQ